MQDECLAMDVLVLKELRLMKLRTDGATGFVHELADKARPKKEMRELQGEMPCFSRVHT
jgi:hypothetical protein